MFARVNIPDFAFAVFLVALGIFAYFLASDLSVGRAGAMGPGYVPRGLALLIALYGVALGLRALVTGWEPFPAIAMRPLLLIAASIALFAVLLPRLGLAFTSVAIVVCSGFAAYDFRWRENALLAAGLAVFAVLLFVLGLGLPIPIWPP